MKTKISITLFLVCLMSVNIFAQPPKVIRTIPRKGDKNVAPGLTTITVVFDQEMNTGGMSLCNMQFKFPDMVGKPKWSDSNTLVFDANLEPNCTYGFSINCPRANNFKNLRGEPAKVYFVVFKTSDGKDSSTKTTPAISRSENKLAIEKLQDAVLHQYSYYSLKEVDWQSLFEKYNEQMLNAKTAKEFAETASTILAYAKDKHIWLIAGEEQIPSYINPITPNVNFEFLPKLVPNFQKRNATICTGKFPDGIGYISVDSWNRQQKEDFEQLYVTLNEFSNAPGLIIDVRGNGGGAEPLAQEFAGCFIDEPKLYAKHITISSGDPNNFTKPQERYVQPNKARPHYRGKTVVLVGPVVMSSCESFVLMMKQVPNCKIIGEPTQGSSGNPKPHDLGNGVTVYLPSWKDLLPDGTCFEGIGIRPDILIKIRPNEITTKDPVIETALRELRQSK